jgi:hypothetical protein
MTTPSQVTRKIFDVRDVPSGADNALKVTENPKHRHLLKNYRRHGLLEVSGRWPEVLVPEMTIEEPSYRLMEPVGHLNGMKEVSAFYNSLGETGSTVFGQLWEEVAVSDYGVFSEALFAWVVPGTSPLLAGDDADPDGTYQIETYYSMVWPYAGGRLVGENVYADPYSRRVYEVPAGSITTPERAAELLAPLLDESPLAEIIDGLRLFQGA